MNNYGNDSMKLSGTNDLLYEQAFVFVVCHLFLWFPIAPLWSIVTLIGPSWFLLWRGNGLGLQALCQTHSVIVQISFC